MIFDLGEYWAGTPQSFYALQARSAMAPGISVFASASGDGPGVSRLLDVQSGTAIINISGPLINSADADLNEWLGAVGYPEIQDALAQATSDPSVQSILMSWSSPGGQVSGVSDAADSVAAADAVKPVYSYARGDMNSAAYLVGSRARRVFTSRMSGVGSIGVITTHTEITRMRQDAGITDTVFRAGEFKALGSPYEPLTDAARGVIQHALDVMNAEFISHVASARGVSPETVRSRMGEGRVFYGQEAVDAGLADGVSTSSALGMWLSQKNSADTVDKSSRFAQSGHRSISVSSGAGPGKLEKNPMNNENGAETVTSGDMPAVSAVAQAAAVAAIEAGLTNPESAEPVAEGQPSEAQPAAQAAAPQADAPANFAQLMQPLQDAIVAARVELAAEKSRTDTLTAQAQASEALIASLRGVAEASVTRLRVALKSGGADVKSMTPEALLQEQAALSESFARQFKAGGVAAVSTQAAGQVSATPSDDPIRQARIAATSIKTA